MGHSKKEYTKSLLEKTVHFRLPHVRCHQMNFKFIFTFFFAARIHLMTLAKKASDSEVDEDKGRRESSQN